MSSAAHGDLAKKMRAPTGASERFPRGRVYVGRVILLRDKQIGN